MVVVVLLVVTVAIEATVVEATVEVVVVDSRMVLKHSGVLRALILQCCTFRLKMQSRV